MVRLGAYSSILFSLLQGYGAPVVQFASWLQVFSTVSVRRSCVSRCFGVSSC